MERTAKGLPDTVEFWVEQFKAITQDRRIPVSEKDMNEIIRMAAHVTLVGDGYSENARGVFWTLVLLFMYRARKKQWRAGVNTLPRDGNALVWLSRIVAAYERHAANGKFQSLSRARVTLNTLIPAMLHVGTSYEPFLEQVAESYLTYPGGVFSERGWDQVQNITRGALGEYRDTHGEYTADAMQRYKTVDV